MVTGNLNRVVVAISDNHVIGRGNGLPWDLPYDLQNFRRLTLREVMVLGRKTLDSLPPAACRGRALVSASRSSQTQRGPLHHCVGSYEEARAISWESGTIVNWVGGRSCIAFALDFVTEIRLTRVHSWVEGDASLELSPPSLGFTRTSWETRHEKGLDFTLEVWQK